MQLMCMLCYTPQMPCAQTSQAQRVLPRDHSPAQTLCRPRRCWEEPRVWQNKLQTCGGNIWVRNWLMSFIMVSDHILSGQQIEHISQVRLTRGHLEHQCAMPFSSHVLDYMHHWHMHSAPYREGPSLGLQSYLGTLSLSHCFLDALIRHKPCLLHTIETGRFLH